MAGHVEVTTKNVNALCPEVSKKSRFCGAIEMPRHTDCVTEDCIRESNGRPGDQQNNSTRMILPVANLQFLQQEANHDKRNHD
jgi:hypothetical protein